MESSSGPVRVALYRLYDASNPWKKKGVIETGSHEHHPGWSDGLGSGSSTLFCSSSILMLVSDECRAFTERI